MLKLRHNCKTIQFKKTKKNQKSKHLRTKYKTNYPTAHTQTVTYFLDFVSFLKNDIELLWCGAEV